MGAKSVNSRCCIRYPLARKAYRWVKSVLHDTLADFAGVEFAQLDARVLTRIVRAVRIPCCRDWRAVESKARGRVKSFGAIADLEVTIVSLGGA